ncbi:MAG TPA: response regulator transcription factor [Chloroflexia bacterium]|jgi:DNA-binding NarL/FixJ family response regulator
MTKKVRVLLADDTLIAREGWKRILETAEDMEVIGEAVSAQEAPRLVSELRPDVVLMDLSWFDDDTAGAAAIAQIRESSPNVKIIALTVFRHLIPDARRAGAVAAIPKDFTREELIKMIRTVLGISDFEPLRETKHGASDLSARELEVLSLMAEGLEDKEIADRLSISTGTAKNHVRNIIAKLDANNRTQAVTVGFRRNILKRGTG